jgi:hypothetical protein
MIELVASLKKATQPLAIGGHQRIRRLVGQHHEHVGLEAALLQPCQQLLLRLNQAMVGGCGPSVVMRRRLPHYQGPPREQGRSETSGLVTEGPRGKRASERAMLGRRNNRHSGL